MIIPMGTWDHVLILNFDLTNQESLQMYKTPSLLLRKTLYIIKIHQIKQVFTNNFLIDSCPFFITNSNIRGNLS